MKQWSKFFQNEEYLEMTRMYTLNMDMLDMVISRSGIKPGMKVLDVGCGSGEYIYYLSKGVTNVEFTGLDFDSDFVDIANKKKDERLCNENSAHFICGDATKMPFENNSFDIVVSHTFFNSIPKYMEALYEMKRVVKFEGKISTIASMNPFSVTISPGVYPPELTWKKRYDELFEKVHNLFEKIAPIKEYLGGISTQYIPFIFSKAELKNVSAYPIGNFISLSNAAMPKEDKIRYINLDYEAEIKRLDVIYAEEGAREFLTKDEVTEYKKLALIRRDYLLKNIETNSIWEWSGSAELLIVGEKPSENEIIMSLFTQKRHD